MGLFDFIKNQEKQKMNNIDLAEGLFNTLIMSSGSVTETRKRQVEEILKECPTRQDVLNKVIQLCGEPVTPQGIDTLSQKRIPGQKLNLGCWLLSILLNI